MVSATVLFQQELVRRLYHASQGVVRISTQHGSLPSILNIIIPSVTENGNLEIFVRRFFSGIPNCDGIIESILAYNEERDKLGVVMRTAIEAMYYTANPLVARDVRNVATHYSNTDYVTLKSAMGALKIAAYMTGERDAVRTIANSLIDNKENPRRVLEELMNTRSYRARKR